MRIIPKILIGICPALFALSACSSSGTTTAADSDQPTVVVTYSVLGSIVEQLVGDAATVTTLIPDGQDPHEFEPSAKDIESLNNASIVVSNGLDFEEGLEETLESAKTAGVNIFMAGDHITVRELSNEDDDHADEATTDTTVVKEEEHDHGASDPHLWLSPAAMLEMLPELSKAVGAAIGAVVAAGFGAPETAGPPPLLLVMGIAVELIPDIIKTLRYIN